jgi:hypothetical protein
MMMSLCPSLLCLYIRSWTQSPLLLPQIGHSASRDCLSVRWKKLKKQGGCFDFIFLGLTLESKSMSLLKFLLLFRCVFEAIFKIKVSRVS